VTISGGNAVRLFQVDTNVDFQARGLTFADGLFVGPNGGNGDPPAPGQDGFGAGILNNGGTAEFLQPGFRHLDFELGTFGYDLRVQARVIVLQWANPACFRGNCRILILGLLLHEQNPRRRTDLQRAREPFTAGAEAAGASRPCRLTGGR